MLSYFRENFEIWFVGLGFLLFADWGAIRAFRRRLSGSGLRGSPIEIGESQQTGRFHLERTLLRRKYASSPDRALVRLGDLALTVRLAYFAWFAFGLVVIFWKR